MDSQQQVDALGARIWPGGVKQFYQDIGMSGKNLEYYLREYPLFAHTFVKKDYTHHISFKTGVVTGFNCCIGGLYAFCGAQQMLNFSYSPHLSEEKVHQILDGIFQDLRPLGHYSHRLLLGMVERRYDSNGNQIIKTKDDTELDEVEEIENPHIVYPHIYTWCKKQRKCKTLGLMWNRNTGNILHNLEVII